MKIAMVVNTLERGFAIPNCVENLTRCYNQLGHTAKIFTFKKTEPFYKVPYEECRFAGKRIPVSFLEHPVFRWMATAALYSSLKHFQPDIVNVDYTPLDWHVSQLKKVLHFKMSYTYYGAPPSELYEGNLRKEKISRKQRMFRYLKKADMVISISQFLQKELNEGKIASKVIPVGIDTEHFIPGKKFPNIEKKGPVLLHVGRIVPHKGFEDLISIFKIIKNEIPSVKLYLIGKQTIPEHWKKIQALCNGLKDDIFFTGFVSDSVLPYFHNLADVFICTSRWEGSGTVLLEAQSCGVPVVAYRLHSFPEAVQDGKTGVLVEDSRTDKFADAVLHFLRNPEKLPQVKILARKYAEQFDWKFAAENTLHVYSELSGNTKQ